MATINHWFLNEFVPALCRTFLHSLWQGLLAALLGAVIFLCTKRSGAVVRYNSLLLLFFGMVIVSTITFVRELNRLTEVSAGPTFLSSSVPPGEFANLPSTFTTEETTSAGQEVYSFIDRNAFLLMSLWTFFFVLHLFRMLIGLRHIQSLQRKEVQPSSSEWTKWIQDQSLDLGITRPVQVLESALIKVPAAIGFFKPVILLPVGLLTGLPPTQVEGILRHELAHIKRGDYLVNLLQRMVDALFFFNPAMVWLSSLIRRERESCCDDIAIQSPKNGPAYVEALLSFQSWHQPPSIAMSLSTGRNNLLRRAKRILIRENDSLTKREAIGLLLGTMLFTTGLLSFRSIDDDQPVNNEVEAKRELAASQPDSFIIPAASFATSLLQDTVPSPMKKDTVRKKAFKKIITNKVDDGKGKTEQIIATDKEGTEYRIRKEGGQVKQLKVNGKTISKEAEQQYTAEMDAIQQQQEQQAKTRELREQKQALARTQQLVKQTDLLNKRLLKLDNDHQNKKRELLNRQHEILKKQQNLLQNNKTLLHRPKGYFDSLRRNQVFPKKISAFGGSKPKFLSGGMNPTLGAILQDLKAQQMITDEARVSFILREGELVIDGKAQPQNIYEVFRKKYLKSPGDRFSYYRDGNTTKTEVNIQ